MNFYVVKGCKHLDYKELGKNKQANNFLRLSYLHNLVEKNNIQ